MFDDEPKTGPADVTHVLTDAMERAGVHPAYIAAVHECGFIYTEENASTLRPEQVERWHQAVEAWFDSHPDDPEA
jgi:hypothetical protein